MQIEMLLGPYGLVAGMIVVVVHLYRENTALRKDSMDLLRKYQDRDEEERKLLKDQQALRQERSL